jgi:site-specific DNA-cytosine methylase
MLGLNTQERIAAMRFGFQTDTVAYILSVLKEMYPDGLTVLSIYSGVGGAEVALHGLGIPLKGVVSVEESEVNRKVLKRWWRKTKQSGQLRQVSSISKVNTSVLKDLMNEFGRFDLVVGGTYSSCSDGRKTVNSTMGMDACQFYNYARVVKSVRRMHRLR